MNEYVTLKVMLLFNIYFLCFFVFGDYSNFKDYMYDFYTYRKRRGGSFRLFFVCMVIQKKMGHLNDKATHQFILLITSYGDGKAHYNKGVRNALPHQTNKNENALLVFLDATSLLGAQYKVITLDVIS